MNRSQQIDDQLNEHLFYGFSDAVDNDEQGV